MRLGTVVFVILLVVGLILNACETKESEQPRSGYYDTGQTGTADECQQQGGSVVGDVCYLP